MEFFTMRILDMTVMALIGLGVAAPSFAEPAVAPDARSDRKEAYDARSAAEKSQNKAEYAKKQAAYQQMRAKRGEAYRARSTSEKSQDQAQHRAGMKEQDAAKPNQR
jgi:hypothetical protein